MKTSTTFCHTMTRAAGMFVIAAVASTSLPAYALPYIKIGDIEGEVSVQAGAEKNLKTFNGSTRNWFDPNNWSDGLVPGPNDDVELDANDKVVIDPSQGHMPVRIGKLTLRDDAVLETRPGTIMMTGDTLQMDNSQTRYHGSAVVGGNDIVASNPEAVRSGNGGDADISMNPSTQDKRDIVINTKMTLQMGLGGRTPAELSTDAAGAQVVMTGYGYHATLKGDTVNLGTNLATLEISLHYGFVPTPGDQFQIITARHALRGQFAGLPHGALVSCSDEGIGLRISYRGGDGNDVVLSAERTDAEECSHRSDVTSPESSLSVITGVAAQTREHILLASVSSDTQIFQQCAEEPFPNPEDASSECCKTADAELLCTRGRISSRGFSSSRLNGTAMSGFALSPN